MSDEKNQKSCQASLPTTSNSQAPMFQIKKWNHVAFWKWEVNSDMCAICRATVMDACLKCESENKSDDCVIVWGSCNHSFHKCCMEKWIQRTNRCPLCQQEWISRRSHKFGAPRQPQPVNQQQSKTQPVVEYSLALDKLT